MTTAHTATPGTKVRIPGGIIGTVLRVYKNGQSLVIYRDARNIERENKIATAYLEAV